MSVTEDLPIVVVVDDEQHTVGAAMRALRKRCKVFGALNGADALELVRAHDVSLVITDQRMPGMTGIELLERIRILSPKTKRVILSGFADKRDLIDAINRGSVSRYLVKPITPAALRELVDQEVEPDPLRQGTRVGIVVGPEGVDAIAQGLIELRAEVRSLSEVEAVDGDFLAKDDIALLLVCLEEAGGERVERILAAAARVHVDVVLLTQAGSFHRAAELLRRGACDLVRSPPEPAELIAVVSRALRRRAAEAELTRLRNEHDQTSEFRDLVCSGPVMQRVMTAIQSVSATDATVLLLGETGVGKEVMARAIHNASRRRKAQLVPVHCAALTGTLLESELFGHEKGAFTGATERRVGRFERAQGGTLFLDEVGDIPLDTQVKLLRVLQERSIERVGGSGPVPVDVRVIAATHRDLEALVAQGLFRQDLYYRLRVIPLVIPPLRDRPDEIRALVEHFLALYQSRDQKQGIRLSPDSLAALERHDWPGNVRELQNAVERAVAYTPDGKPIDPGVFGFTAAPPLVARDNGEAQGYVEDLAAIRSIHQAVEGYERHLVSRILARHMWNQSRAAAQLGITRQSLSKKIAKLRISRA